jgi:hypothetical protein
MHSKEMSNSSVKVGIGSFHTVLQRAILVSSHIYSRIDTVSLHHLIIMWILVFCIMMPCSDVGSYQRFEETPPSV